MTIETIEGRPTLVVQTNHGLPKSLEDLLGQMATFGFTFRDDPVLGGTSVDCEQARTHRFVRFREGRWWAPRPLHIHGGGDSVRIIPAGVLTLALTMCQDCGAVCVRDVSLEMWAGARPARLINVRTGNERTAPAQDRRSVVIGWYSGKRRAGREFK